MNPAWPKTFSIEKFLNFETDVTWSKEEIKGDVNSKWMETLGCWAYVNNERAEYATLDLKLKWQI